MRNKYVMLNVVFMLVLFIFMGCSDDSTKSKSVDEFQLAAQAANTFFDGGVKVIPGVTVYNAIQAGTAADDYYILDIRGEDTYALGHIPGAIEMTAAEIDENLDALPTDKAIVVVCYTGQTASQTTGYLNVLGYDAYALKWGMCGWTNDESVPASSNWLNLEPYFAEGAEAGQLEVTANDITALEEQDYPDLDTGEDDVEDIILTAMDAYIESGWKMVGMDATLWTNLSNYFIIDLRQETHYNNGHLPGAYRVAMADLGYDESLKYLPADQEILVVCYTSHTANQVTSVLNMLGYDAYNLRYGMSSVTLNTDISGGGYTAPPSGDDAYPLVVGSNPN